MISMKEILLVLAVFNAAAVLAGCLAAAIAAAFVAGLLVGRRHAD